MGATLKSGPIPVIVSRDRWPPLAKRSRHSPPFGDGQDVSSGKASWSGAPRLRNGRVLGYKGRDGTERAVGAKSDRDDPPTPRGSRRTKGERTKSEVTRPVRREVGGSKIVRACSGPDTGAAAAPAVSAMRSILGEGQATLSCLSIGYRPLGAGSVARYTRRMALRAVRPSHRSPASDSPNGECDGDQLMGAARSPTSCFATRR